MDVQNLKVAGVVAFYMVSALVVCRIPISRY
jgi:hypothetical protein